jgi:hypothetical protein
MSRKSLIASMSSVVVIAASLLLAIPAPAYASSRSDSDHDGMSNSWEHRFHLNARHANGRADADHDGLTNLQEFRLGTNPRLEDSDRDGLEDPFEDSDHDGLDNEDDSRRVGLDVGQAGPAITPIPPGTSASTSPRAARMSAA